RLERRARPYDATEDMALGDVRRPPPGSEWLVRRVADPDAAEARRANYRTLLDAVGPHVPPPFDQLPATASPFVFPLEVDDKAAALAELSRRGVDGLDFWAVPHPDLPVDRFPAAARRRSTVVGLPVHQGLRAPDVERIAEAARAVSARRRGTRR